jgi:hypothetical protein
LIKKLAVDGAVGAESSGRAALLLTDAGTEPSILFHTCALLLSLCAETEPGHPQIKLWMNLIE